MGTLLKKSPLNTDILHFVFYFLQTMLKSYTKQIEGIGRVLFERSLRAKNLIIRMKPLYGTRVAVPTGMTFRRAEKIVNLKKSWIEKVLVKTRKIEERQKKVLKTDIDIKSSAVRKKIILRLDELSKEYGFTYNRVFIRNQKTRWGSCSNKNNINLNRKLIYLPDELSDYVILHELLHTRIKNHSKTFWVELGKVLQKKELYKSENDQEINFYKYAKKKQRRLKELGFIQY